MFATRSQNHFVSAFKQASFPLPLGSRRFRTFQLPRSAAAGSIPLPDEEEPKIINSAAAETPADTDKIDIEPTPPSPETGVVAWLKQQQAKSAVLKKKLVALGPAAVLAYGLFDGISYTIAFSIAFLGYEAQTGLNPTQNVADLIKIVILMWAGNNVTRPFRLAGAAALAPFMDRFMGKLQARLKLPNKMYAFAMITAGVAALCFSVVGVLFISRMVVA